MRAQLTLFTVVYILTGCIEADAMPSTLGDRALQVKVTDWVGEPSDPRFMARRPQFHLIHNGGLATDHDAFLLFIGEPTDELIEDLTQAPLRSEHLDLLAEQVVLPTENGAVLAPTATLDPNASYSLAVAAWAKTRDGAPLSDVPQLFALHTAAEASAGARALASWPADGATAVGTNLEAAVIAFDGIVQNIEQGVWLEGPDGLAVPAQVESGECQRLAPEHKQPFCVRILPEGRLAPGAWHALFVGTDAYDGHGAPIEAWHSSFRTSSSRDDSMPTLLPITCAVDEQALALGCALVDDGSITLRVLADEGVLAEMVHGDAIERTVAPDGSCALRLTSLSADTQVAFELKLRDSAGNTTLTSHSLRTLPPLATLSISEVRADPLGPEPAQEYVELWNYGSRSVDLLGFTLHDRVDELGEPFSRSLRVEPETRVLIVAESFDMHDNRDVAPPPGAPMLRAGRSLASGGLSNAGERLYLRDASGQRISAAPAEKSRPGVCLTRKSSEPRDGDASAFEYDADKTCTPGR